jgi:type VI secretion system protein VasG
MAVTPRALIGKLNVTCQKALSEAFALCTARGHADVELEHWLLVLMNNPANDLAVVARQYDLDPRRVRRELGDAVDKFRTGNTRGSVAVSADLLTAVREAWMFASLEHDAGKVRSAHLLWAVLDDKVTGDALRKSSPELGRLSAERLRADLGDLLPRAASEENERDAAPAPAAGGPAAPTGPAPAAGKTPALDQFTVNLTAAAKAGKLDPVVGRDAEIRQVVEILTRRRQNNPILTGEAGVGKTAVVEGLALRVAAGDLPQLKDAHIHTLDLGLLQAGAGVKGEFENRLKNVIDEVKRSPAPIVLFVDEAHTLIGAGGAAGQNDAANLLKPALARGELRTIAATTFAEYKKYFQADAALRRRFQVVRIDEPDERRAVRMVRGLVPALEAHHKVRILDEAVGEAVRLSARYMPDRLLPDKAVGLLDTVCTRVALSQTAVPSALEDARREVEHLAAEIGFLEREGRAAPGNPERVAELARQKEAAAARAAALEAQLGRERALVEQIRARRAALEAAAGAAAPPPEADRAELARLDAELAGVQGETPLVYPAVTGVAAAAVVASQTGIPLGKMVRDEVQTVLNLAARLEERVVGQRDALEAIARRIRTARADLADPRRPQGVFLLVGPSGVGKTETALALADLLYGGDRNMVVVNMSEYKEGHKVSRLVGTAKGYVGYGEGGVLTNAVKNRPHSVVLLDEVEKAHESVQEIFYQMFDKGVLQNDDGEDVNFKNTIVLLTSNVGTDTIAKACADPDTAPAADGLTEMLKGDLLKAFKPALLGRMTVVPYRPLGDDVLRAIVAMKLDQIGDRLRRGYRAAFAYEPAVVELVAARCKDVETGARNADHIITGTVLAEVSARVLGRVADGTPVRRVAVGVGADSHFTYAVE